MYLAKHPEEQMAPDVRPFWLAYSYDAEVLNGGHLQYFHNNGAEDVPETLEALHLAGAHEHAALLESCWRQVQSNPVHRVGSLEEYASVAAKRSFVVEDDAYYKLSPEVLELLEAYFDPLLRKLVAVSA
jgi:hypothetical protein